jgi:ABC-2 type transport system permease protein
MYLSRVLAIALRQFFLIRGSIARITPLFAWAAIDIVLWGFTTRFLTGIVPPTLNLVSTLLGAILLWNFLIRIMQGITTTFLEDVWVRNFLNIFAAPITLPEYLSGLVLSSIGTSIVGVLVMLIVAAFFGFTPLAYGALLVPFVLVLFLFAIALGIAAAALVLRLGPAAEWFTWPIPALISPFVGVLYPISVLPPWMRAISRILPPSYVFEGMRNALEHGTVSIASLAWGALLAIAFIALACWLFVRVFRFAIRTGLLARYSAESVS